MEVVTIGSEIRKRDKGMSYSTSRPIPTKIIKLFY